MLFMDGPRLGPGHSSTFFHPSSITTSSVRGTEKKRGLGAARAQSPRLTGNGVSGKSVPVFPSTRLRSSQARRKTVNILTIHNVDDPSGNPLISGCVNP